AAAKTGANGWELLPWGWHAVTVDNALAHAEACCGAEMGTHDGTASIVIARGCARCGRSGRPSASMTSKPGCGGRNTSSKRDNCFRNCPILFLLIRSWPKWLHSGGLTMLSTLLNWRRG